MDIEQYSDIKNYCNSFNTPVALFDGELACIYCNREGFFNKGERLVPYLLTLLERPVLKSAKAKVMIGGSVYCVRVVPFGKEFFICEFMDIPEVLSIAENTDVYDVLIPGINAMSHSVSSLWKNSFALADYLREKGDFETVDKLLDFDKTINSVSSTVSNISEYIDELFAERDFSYVEVYRMIKGMVERCNSILRRCDRAIDFSAELDEYYINSNKQHVIAVLINAVQNALLYSPKDCIPVITLSSVLEGETRYVVLKVVNDSIYFVNEKYGEKIDRNFSFQHFGLGLPIIRKFAEKCNGFFSMEEHNGKVLVEIKIPQYIPSGDEFLCLESPGYAYYKTDLPDFIDIKMNDIVNFFGKK